MASWVTVVVTDDQHASIPGASCAVQSADGRELARGTTDSGGLVRLNVPGAGHYVLMTELEGFTTSRTPFDVNGLSSADVAVVLRVSAIASTVDVAALPGREIAPSAGATLPAAIVSRPVMERLPLSFATTREVFSLAPSVVRGTNGELSFKGASEQQSGLLINGANAADPGSGSFRLDLPVDAVEEVQVFLHPYTAEYGQFTGGITAVETRSAGDTWHFELNDFLPDLRFVNGDIVGIAEDSPHLNISGPLLSKRVHLSHSTSYTIANRPVRGLAYPDNETRTEGHSHFTQIDANLFTGHAERVTIGYFPQRRDYVGLDVFRPRPVTPTVKQRDMTLTARENAQVKGGLFSAWLSLSRFQTNVSGRGDAEQTFTPMGERGNYFATQDRRAGRAELFMTYAAPVMRFLGDHEVKAGIDLNDLGNRLAFAARPVNILRGDGTLAQRVDFETVPAIRAKNREYIGFVQDRWHLATRLTVDLGLRYEDQRLADAQALAPRAGFAYSLTADGLTVVRGGAGLFYDKVPLNLRSFPGYPARTVTTYAADGLTAIERQVFSNVLLDAGSGPYLNGPAGEANDRDAIVPENLSWNVQIDRTLARGIVVRANYISSTTDGMFVVDPEVNAAGQGAIVLRSSGRSTYRALELAAHVGRPGRTFDVSYTRSHARADLNTFASLFGDVATPIVRPNQFSFIPTDTPNRFLAWGSFDLPRRFSVSPIVELRTGFPYSAVDESQNFVGIRNAEGTRFPPFFALDVEVAKALQVTKKYAVRLSIRCFNLTNHYNPRDVHLNVADPQFGRFLASDRRYFAGGFDILF
jgi:hypothetical protein